MAADSFRICTFYKHPHCQVIDSYTHRPLVATNETGQAKTLETLKKSERIGTGFIGVGGFFNLNAASRRKLDVIILIDCGLRVGDFWQDVEEIIRTNDNRQEVISKIQMLLRRNASQYFTGGSALSGLDNPDTVAEIEIENFQREIDQNLSWLSDNERFNKIKKIFRDSCFFFMQADLFDPNQMEDIRSILQGAKITVDTIYLSNLGEYADGTLQRSRYITAMKKLIAPKTHVISGHFSTEMEDPMQFIRQKKDTSMETFLFPEAADIPELAPDRTMVLCHSLYNLGCWIDDHRASLKKMSIIACGVAVVFFTRRAFL